MFLKIRNGDMISQKSEVCERSIELEHEKKLKEVKKECSLNFLL